MKYLTIKKTLRPGEDDDKLFKLLTGEFSDKEMLDDEKEEIDFEEIAHDKIDFKEIAHDYVDFEEIGHEEIEKEQSDEEALYQREESEFDEEDLLPLSVVRDNLLVVQAQNDPTKAKRTA
ncbi:unnamed protein product [Brassicogethes aeneus]|uniref:Uncharacterized protein n=1 Tax=Brassicogethes aeneus TaxID=1431903 RepID=A0A9P0FJK1_BRAAE|nr:unnamed protein product [Brassicogethes aeneus]